MKKSKMSLRRKAFVVFILLLTCFFALGVRLAYVQLVEGDELQQKAENARTRELSVAAKRGIIYDRNGKKLAISLSADSIYATPTQVIKSGNAESTAKTLSELLNMDYDNMLKRITSNNAFVWIKRKADYDVAQQIREADLKGIDIVEETMRFYPNGMLASHILGFAGVDNQGLDGIEKSMDETLSGVPGSIVTEYDARGTEIPQAVKEYNPPQDGQSLVLTIDETLQYFVERELDAVMAWDDPPAGATIVIMNPNTAEILAMGSRPSYDPNNYGEYDQSSFRNRAVTDVYEPGSTFKMITLSAALDCGAVNTNSRFYDPGYTMIGKIKMKCWRHYNPHGSQNLYQIMQNSCNPGLVQVETAMEEKQKGIFYQYIHNYGFGTKTGINLPGESAGIMIADDKVTTLNLANIAIGQSIAVTPLQMITAASAVVNGGKLLEPQIVRQVVNSDGKVVQDFEVKEVRQVISKETSDLMRDILETVVAQGTAKRGYIEGFRVGGKTGTAQKVGDGGYEDGKYDASFLGFAPANDPQLIALVIIHEPSGELYQGGQIAAPVFASLMEDCLRYWGVTAQTDLDAQSGNEQTVESSVTVPDVVNLSADDAVKVLTIAGLKVEVKGEGSVVVSQTPGGFSSVKSGTTVILNMGEKSVDSDAQITVPDLTGKRVREAAEILSAMGLTLKTNGVGEAVEQNPIPGTKVISGDIIEVTFNTSEPDDEVQDVIAP